VLIQHVLLILVGRRGECEEPFTMHRGLYHYSIYMRETNEAAIGVTG